MLSELFIFIVSLLMVIQGATMATKHAALLAESYRLSKYAVGFIIVAVISILPEGLISLNATIAGMPEFGLGTLFGSNIADLTLAFAILVWVAGRSLKVETKILRNHSVYPFILLLPLILGLDGNFSRLDGGALILTGGIFYYLALKDGSDNSVPFQNGVGRRQHIWKLLLSMAILLVGAHFTVTSSTALAHFIGINPILIGMLVVGLGTVIPELAFSIKCVRKKDDSLAMGDMLGTVLADATILVGLLALISPFDFPIRIIYVTGAFMVAAAFMLFVFMRSGRHISRTEALFLLLFWVIFVLTEFLVAGQ